MGNDTKDEAKNGDNSLFAQFNKVVDATSAFTKAIFPPAYKFVGKIKSFMKKKDSDKKLPEEEIS